LQQAVEFRIGRRKVHVRFPELEPISVRQRLAVSAVLLRSSSASITAADINDEMWQP